MPKPLKIWNGHATHVMHAKHDDPRWENARGGNGSYEVHAYVCAHSRADALRIIAQYSGIYPGADNSIRTYWHMGSWGNAMNGITPERGLWLQFGHRNPNNPPVRVV